MRFDSLNDFNSVFFNDYGKFLIGYKDYQLYKLDCKSKQAMKLEHYNNVNSFTDEKYVYYFQSNIDITYREINDKYIEDLQLVYYSDCFYGKFNDFKQLPFWKEIVQYIMDKQDRMSFEDAHITWDDYKEKYILIKYVEQELF